MTDAQVLPRVLGLTVAGVLVIVLYIACNVLGALFGASNPLGFMILVGVALTAVFTSVIMYLASTGGDKA